MFLWLLCSIHLIVTVKHLEMLEQKNPLWYDRKTYHQYLLQKQEMNLESSWHKLLSCPAPLPTPSVSSAPLSSLRLSSACLPDSYTKPISSQAVCLGKAVAHTGQWTGLVNICLGGHWMSCQEWEIPFWRNEGGKRLTTYRCFAAETKEWQSKSCKMCNLEFFQISFFNKRKVNSFPIHLFWENLQSFPSSAPFWSQDKRLKPKLSICSISGML